MNDRYKEILSEMNGLPSDLMERFDRNIKVEEIGVKGQKKLLSSSVLVVGCGGLGSAVIHYLAVAGVGRLGLADFDRVSLSNLQRQILHGEKDLGRIKVESARHRVRELTSITEIKTYNLLMDEESLSSIAKEYDVIVDGTDNFKIRYDINRVCIKYKIPFIMGAVLSFSGQATTIIPGETPCYRCIFPSPPPEDIFPTSKTIGILSGIPGVIGTIQATETIKILTGVGTPLKGRLLLFDGFNMTFKTVPLHRDKDCLECKNL